MKYDEALPKIREMGNKMQEHADTATLASRTYTATMELYNIAASAGDKAAMEQHRNTIHSTVDIILDAGAMVAELTREQKAIAQSVTDWPQQ